jgi:hypothetical protein
MSTEFDAALKDVDESLSNMVESANKDYSPVFGAALIVGGVILSSARLLALAIRDSKPAYRAPFASEKPPQGDSCTDVWIDEDIPNA